MTHPALRVQVLGGFSIDYGGSPVVLRPERAQSLLAYLMLRKGTAQRRAHLAALLWPDSSDAQARTNLRKLVLEIRRALPQAEQYLEVDAATLAWRAKAPYTADVEEFERAAAEASPASLERAVACYRGDLLPGCYEEWVLSERERLRRLYTGVLERLVAVLESRRAYSDAIAYGRQLLDQDPLREATYQLLMRLYAQMGDRAGALHVYHTCATALQRELGVEPSALTRSAYERLLSGEAERVPPPMPAAPRLVGREREWERIRSAWAEASSGRAHVVLLAGEAGIGKTRLADEVLEWAARQGVATAVARCFGAEGRLAYAPVAMLLRSRPLPPLAEPWRREIARVLPELAAERGHPSGAAPPLTEGWQRRRLFEAMARALLAHRPLVAVVDDLQWCDPDSLEWLHYLTRHEDAEHVLLVATVRSAPRPDRTAERTFASWRHDGRLTEIEIAPLDAPATAILAGAASGVPPDDSVAERIFRVTGGNPLFVVELARAGWTRPGAPLDGALPPRVRAVIESRLAGLSPQACDAAAVAAVIGRPFTFRFLARVAGGEEAPLVEAVDELWQSRVLRESGTDTYAFSHDAVREVVYGRLSRHHRAWLHGRTAEALVHEHSPAVEAPSGEIATHFDLSGAQAQAVPYYRRAAQAARNIYANELAAGYYERLVAITAGSDRIDALCALGDVWQLTGRSAQAAGAYRRALELAEQIADQAAQARCRTALGRVLVLFRGAYEEALVHLESAGAVFRLRGDRAGLADVVWHMGIAHWYQGNYEQALDCYAEMRRLASEAGDRGRIAEAVGHAGLVYDDLGDHARALACFEEHLAIARDLGDRASMARAMGNVGTALQRQGRHAEALAWFAESWRTASAIGAERSMAIAAGNAALVYHAGGETAQAIRYGLWALARSVDIGDEWHASVAAGNVARGLMLQGQYADAERLLAAAVAVGRRLGAPYHLCKHLAWQAEVALARGSPADARPLATEALRVAQRAGRRDIQLTTGVLLVQLQVALGEASVPAAVAELDRLRDAWPAPADRALLHDAAWQLDRTLDDHREAAAALYRAAYETHPVAEYRARYRELTGDSLPSLPPLPRADDLEQAVRSSAALDAVLAALERLVAEAEERSGTPGDTPDVPRREPHGS